MDSLNNITSTITISEYHLKDHLGNTRVTVDNTGKKVQTNNYYPFGMTFATSGNPTNKYLYNGKEQQEETDWLDYGARFYMADIGRWGVTDPLSEWHFNTNQYHYCFNNPINFIDPFGLDTIPQSRVNPNTFDPSKDVVKIDPVTCTYERPSWFRRTLNKIGRLLSDTFSEGNGETVSAGYVFYMGRGGASPAKTKAHHIHGYIDIGDLLSAIGGTGAGKFSRTPLSVAQGLSKVNDIVSNNTGTTDKDIVNSSTGIAQKTKSNGRPIIDKGQVVTEYWVNNSNDTISIASGDGTYDGEIYFPGDTIGATTLHKVGITTKVLKEKKYPSRR